MTFRHPRVRVALCAVWSGLLVGSALAQQRRLLEPRPPRPSLSPNGPTVEALPDATAPRVISLFPAGPVAGAGGVAQIQIGFDEAVTVPAGAVIVRTLNGGILGGVVQTYNPATDTLTLDLPAVVTGDRVTVVVSDAVADGAGNALDGEVMAPAAALLPSGNGLAGGVAVFSIAVLAGDANGDGAVDTADAGVVLDALGRCAGESGYDPAADLNVDGCVNALDAGLVTLNEGAVLPATDGVAPAVIAIDAADPASLVVRFSEALDAATVNARSVSVNNAAGSLLVPAQITLAGDARSLTADFATPLADCDVYHVNISNGMADPSGTLLATVSPAPLVGALPAAPVLDAFPSAVSTSTVDITGLAPRAVQVEVVTPDDVFLVPVAGAAFSVTVPLSFNRTNFLYFTAISGCDGSRSAAAVAAVTHDQQAPNLFIDFPAAGSGLTTAAVDVAGRVGDTLSGFAGLTVSVNGVAAAVDIGIGTNGTFFAPAVPLTPGAPTVLEATAIDALGNIATAAVTVQQVAVPPASPQIVLLSGNAQTAAVNTVLADPVVVRMTRGDGTPFADKIVTFRVTRSDGRLSADGVSPGALVLQRRTDAAGEAEVFWRLGSDAGCGNNRLEVVSTSIVGSVFACASATASPATQVNIGTGNHQRTEVGAVVPEPLRVWVSDGRNGVPGVPVTFTVVSGGGAVQDAGTTTVVTSATGHATVSARTGLTPGAAVIEADFPGNMAAPARFTVTGLARDLTQPTRFAGVVLDNARRPVQGATVTLTVGDEILTPVTSDLQGRFSFGGILGSGTAHLHIDGLTAFHVGGEEGVDVPFGSFPALAFETVIVANAANHLPMPALLPPLDPTNAVEFDNTADVELTVAGLEGVKMTIRAGSMTRADDSVPSADDPAIVSLNQVHFDEIPMPMPDGASPPFAWTLQPGGARFDPPVTIELPNMTGLAPGAIMYFLSFDHDVNRFDIVASGRVSADGATLVSDPGAGIRNAGWGGFCPPYPNTGGVDKDGDGIPDPPGHPDQEPGPKHAPPGAPTNGRKDPCDEDGGADPIYFFSGEFYEPVEDLRIKGRGLDFVWSRKYRSKLGLNSAQGNGWDCSYNIFLEEDAFDVFVCDGNSRKDRYLAQVDGSWTRPGFFRRLIRNPDGSHTLTYPDSGSWTFRAFDGSPSAGKLVASTDRNGNQLSFAYDGAGRLTTVTDTLGRDIAVAYNVEGFIESVTDFIGRQVTYTYYQDGEPGGSAGDLKSVTTPAVTGTPHGNDFPAGKTTLYTYSTGFADDRLNHNLLTITDPKGQTYLVNEYATTTNPEDLLFDRVVRQTWGDPGDTVDITYLQQVPQSANNQATIRVILNDRVGNVKEYYYDKRNRNVMIREFTGRADPDQPTTATQNRPAGQVRPGDPAFFETRHTHNSDSLRVRTIHPNGTITRYYYEGDLSRNVAVRTRANLRAIVRLPGSHVPAGDQAALTEVFEYDALFGSGCCGSNFVTRHIDARGNVTAHEYDSAGNRTRSQYRRPEVLEEWEYNAFGQMTARVWPDNGSGHRRRDEWTYYDSGPENGYLQRQILDATGFALTTLTEVDGVGNVTSLIDPRGHDAQVIFNARNQRVREISREVTDGSGVRYQRDYYYDANDNLERIEVQNIDDSGVVQANSHLATTYQYDVLNVALQMTEEVDGGSVVTTAMSYDANRNRTLIRKGEAVNGNQPANTISFIYDERDLLFERVRAAGHADQSTTRLTYDPNRNRVLRTTGLEDTPQTTQYVFDGYDRLVTVVDALGNERQYTYDANGNRRSSRFVGEAVDLAGAALNQRLSESAYEYDELDRLTREVAQHFDSVTQAPIGDGTAVTVTEYNPNSQVVRVVDDNGHGITRAFDTANRLALETDHLGNSMAIAYDANSNRTSVTETAKSDLGGADEVFVTTFAYDNLDRLASEADNRGNATLYRYDSRHNRVLEIDALGHEARFVYDGLDRLVATIRDLDNDGADGDGADITTTQAWDHSSRLIGQTDDQGNATLYGHDPLGRLTTETAADGTVRTHLYDAHDNIVSWVDANGSVVTCGFDLRNRLISKSIVPGAGVSPDTTFETYQYDGLSRVVRSEDDDAVATTAFDSLSNLVSESINGVTTVHTFDGVGNRWTSLYPSGRLVSTTYDELDRQETISSDGVSISYSYVGADRVQRRDYGNGTRTGFTYDGITGVPDEPGDFGVKMISRTAHTVIGNGTVIDERSYRWDAMFNKTRRRDERVGGAQLTHAYSYDAIYRLDEVAVTDGAKVPVRTTDYDHDGVGNRVQVTGGAGAGAYTLDRSVPQPADAQTNQYSTTPYDQRTYDDNGNLVAIDVGLPTERTIVYDYRNQMVEVADPGGVRHHYAYDANGRRIARIVDADGVAGGPAETRYYYDGWRVCEERDGGGAVQATYLYGRYMDEVLSMRRGGQDYYYHCDDQHNVMALTDGTGAVVERYEYQDFGDIEITDDAGAPRTSSAVGNPYGFQGRRCDPETGWYYFRTRYLDPLVGRFTIRDTIGTWGVPPNIGGAFTFVSNNPWTWVDPTGEADGWWNKLKEAVGGAVSVGPYDAYRAAYGDLGSWAQQVGRDFAARHPENRGGYQNAARHAAWQAKLVQEFGFDKAKKIADLHELGETNRDSAVDLHNNEIGREIGQKAKSDEEIRRMIEEALRDGRLIVDENDPRVRGKGPCDGKDTSSSDSSSSDSSNSDSSSHGSDSSSPDTSSSDSDG